MWFTSDLWGKWSHTGPPRIFRSLEGVSRPRNLLRCHSPTDSMGPRGAHWISVGDWGPLAGQGASLEGTDPIHSPEHPLGLPRGW